MPGFVCFVVLLVGNGVHAGIGIKSHVMSITFGKNFTSHDISHNLYLLMSLQVSAFGIPRVHVACTGVHAC